MPQIAAGLPARPVLGRSRTFSPDEQAIVDELMHGVLGGAATVGARSSELAKENGANELMLSTLVPALADRRASLERIAAALA